MRIRVALLATLWIMWLLITAVVGERVGRDAVDYHSLQDSCTLPHEDSLHGTASWRWWPPGEVCREPSGHVFRQPQPWRQAFALAALAGLVTLPIATVALARRERQVKRDLGEAASLQELVRGEMSD